MFTKTKVAFTVLPTRGCFITWRQKSSDVTTPKCAVMCTVTSVISSRLRKSMDGCKSMGVWIEGAYQTLSGDTILHRWLHSTRISNAENDGYYTCWVTKIKWYIVHISTFNIWYFLKSEQWCESRFHLLRVYLTRCGHTARHYLIINIFRR